MPQVVDRIREFNRFYTRVIGVLQPDLVGSPFTLAEARLLYEIAHAGHAAVADIRTALGLDAGHLSRLLSALEGRGLIEREVSATDRRRQDVRLTDAGRAAFAELDAKQAAAIDELIADLSSTDREDLTAAMSVIRRTLGEHSGGPGVVLRAPEAGDLGWVVERHGARYRAEYGWGTEFEALVARIVADFADRGGQGSAAWIAEIDGRRAGCVFCMPAADPDTAQLRLLLVEPWARGAGVGTRLVDECLRFAKRTGYRRIVLWTNDVLTSARRIYVRAGFTLDRSEPHGSFGENLVGEYWSRDL